VNVADSLRAQTKTQYRLNAWCTINTVNDTRGCSVRPRRKQNRHRRMFTINRVRVVICPSLLLVTTVHDDDEHSAQSENVNYRYDARTKRIQCTKRRRARARGADPVLCLHWCLQRSTRSPRSGE